MYVGTNRRDEADAGDMIATSLAFRPAPGYLTMMQTPSRGASGVGSLTGLGLLLSLILLIAGLFLPAFTLRQFIFSQQVSLVESVFRFLEAGSYFLFAVTFLFTVAFPVAKCCVALMAWGAGRRRPRWMPALLHWFSTLSKWSMLDVFIIAVVVLVLDGKLLTGTEIHVGIVAFAASVLLLNICLWRLQRAAAAPNHEYLNPPP